MSKIKRILLCLILLVAFFSNISVSNAKTMGQLRNELKTLEKKQKENEENETRTQEEIAASKAAIKETQNKIAEGRRQIQEAQDEIKELNKEIKEKQKETEELFRFLQVANGENSYLEYIFGATSMSDLINRLAIVEQISGYNSELIDEMNALIKKNEKLQKKLEEKQKQLEQKITDLSKAINALNGDLNSYDNIAISLEAQVKAKRQQVEHYEDLGCKDDQDLSVCSKMPSASGFVRPTSYGIITSTFGSRTYWINGGWTTDYHYGIDIGTGDEGYNVYAAADGVVAAVFKKQSCGGNMVYIDHDIINSKGKVETYSTAYYHLLSVKVKAGDVVYQDTVIGKVGGGPRTWDWDSCSTGAHLHFGISTVYFDEYSDWNRHAINPKKKISFPSGWFTKRY